MVNLISLRLLLAIASIHEFSSRPIDFVLDFLQSDLDVDVFIELPLGTVVYRNRGKWVLKLNKSPYGLRQASKNWFNHIKTGLEIRGYHKS